MFKRNYPFNAWVLTPTMQVKQVTLVEDSYYGEWHTAETGKCYHDDHLHKTRAAAIAAGNLQLDKHEAKLAKQRDGIAKKRANLEKARLEA